MFSVMTFTLNTIDLFVVTINGNLWIRARKLRKALKYKRKEV